MKNKNLIIGAIVICALVLIVTGTYAYWTLTRSQEGSNILIGGCLNVDITEEGEAIKLEKAWPISDFEGMQLEGYTFTVTNYCEEAQDYRIDLDRLVDEEGRKEMTNKSLATLLDYGVPVLYSELTPEGTTDEEVQEKRVLAYDTVMGKVGDTPGSNTHTLRIWIDEESDIEDQGSTFLSRVEINAGQGIEKYYTPKECFLFDRETGKITLYYYNKENCGLDVVIPYEITPSGATEAVAVTEIGEEAFLESPITSVEFPRSVTKIGYSAFEENLSLEKIVFKNGLVEIEDFAFAGFRTKKMLMNFINFPETLTNMGDAIFVDGSLKQVIVPENSVHIMDTFLGNQIENYKLPKSMTQIPDGIFADNNIKEVIIPDHITKIGEAAFAHNPVEKLILGNGVTEIGKYAFNNSAFSAAYLKHKDQNYLKEIYIPMNVNTIREGAFKSATSDVIITTERTKEDFLANVTTGNKWYGDAQVISSDNLLIYE